MASKFSDLGLAVERLVYRIIKIADKLGTKFKAEVERLFFRIDGFCSNRISACESQDSIMRALDQVGDFFDQSDKVAEAYDRFFVNTTMADGMTRMRTRYKLDARNARLVWDVLYELAGAPIMQGHIAVR